MRTFTLSQILAVTCSALHSKTNVLSEADHASKLMHVNNNLVNTKSAQSPEVGLESRVWGYSFDVKTPAAGDPNGLDTGIEGSFDADLKLGYEFLMYWLYRDSENFLVFNPSLYGEVSSEIKFKIKLYFLQIWLVLDMEAIRGSPLDYQAMWSLDNMANYCNSLGAYMDVFNLIAKFEWHVYECVFGVFGFVNEPDDYVDCFWRRYAPVLPLYEISAVEEGDLEYEYVPWTCTNYDEEDLVIQINERGEEVIEVDGEFIEVENINDGSDIVINEISNI